MLLSLLIGTLPWAFGVVMVYSLLSGSKKWHPGYHLIVIGLGAYIGHLSLALIMHQLQVRNHAVFSEWLVVFGILFTLSTWIAGRTFTYLFDKKINFEIYYTRYPIPNKAPLLLMGVLFIWILLASSFITWEIAYRPATGWDAVSYWTLYTEAFLDWQLSDPAEGSMKLAHRHGSTIHLLHAWSAWVRLVSGTSAFVYTPWLTLYVGLVLSGTGFGWAITKKLVIGLIAGLLIASSNIISGQAALAGYADIWISAGIFFSIAILPLFKISHPLSVALIWTVAVASLIFLISAGITYTVMLLTCSVVAWLLTRGRTLLILLGIGGLLATSWYAYTFGFEISLFNQKLAFTPASGTFIIGIYYGALNPVQWSTIYENMIYSYIVNSTFFLTLLLNIVSLVIGSQNMKQLTRRLGPALCVFTVIGLILHTILAQGVSQHFLIYSSPDTDTGLTRFSQGWFLSSVLLFVYSVQLLTEAQAKPKL